MNSFIKRLAVTVVGVAAMALSAMAQTESAEDTATSELSLIKQYFPLVDGDFREYTAMDFYWVHEHLQTWTTMLDGRVVYALKVDDAYGNEVTYYLKYRKGNLVCFAVGVPGQGLMKFNPPLILLSNEKLAVDGSSSLRSTLTLGNRTASITVKHSVVSLRDPVTVPAGTFTDCKRVRIRMTVEVPGMDPETGMLVWVLAPSVGLIKDRFSDAYGNPLWYELESPESCSAVFWYQSMWYSAPGGTSSGPIWGTYQCEWSVVNPCSDWITVSPMSGAGDATIEIYVARNMTSEPRTCTLTIGDSPFVVTQDAGPSISSEPME